MVEFSVGLSQLLPLRDHIRLSRLVEQFAFDKIYCGDDLMLKPAWPILTLIAEHTKRVQVGPCITHPFLRHPALTAGYVAEIDELSEGRAFLGIGRGAFYEFLEMEPQKPLTAVRESIQLIVRLLSGDRSPFRGEVFRATEEAFLRWKPRRKRVPISIGAWGPKMCQLAGELADELKVDYLWNPGYVPIIRENIRIGAERAGRKPEKVVIASGSICSVSYDRRAALKLAKRQLAVYLPYLSPLTDFVGVDPEEVRRVREAARRGAFDEGAKVVSEVSVKNFCLVGTPEDIIEPMEVMLAAGVRHVGFGSPLGPDKAEAIRLLGKKVVPHFKGKRRRKSF